MTTEHEDPKEGRKLHVEVEGAGESDTPEVDTPVEAVEATEEQPEIDLAEIRKSCIEALKQGTDFETSSRLLRFAELSGDDESAQLAVKRMQLADASQFYKMVPELAERYGDLIDPAARKAAIEHLSNSNDVNENKAAIELAKSSPEGDSSEQTGDKVMDRLIAENASVQEVKRALSSVEKGGEAEKKAAFYLAANITDCDAFRLTETVNLIARCCDSDTLETCLKALVGSGFYNEAYHCAEEHGFDEIMIKAVQERLDRAATLADLCYAVEDAIWKEQAELVDTARFDAYYDELMETTKDKEEFTASDKASGLLRRAATILQSLGDATRAEKFMVAGLEILKKKKIEDHYDPDRIDKEREEFAEAAVSLRKAELIKTTLEMTRLTRFHETLFKLISEEESELDEASLNAIATFLRGYLEEKDFDLNAAVKRSKGESVQDQEKDDPIGFAISFLKKHDREGYDTYMKATLEELSKPKTDYRYGSLGKCLYFAVLTRDFGDAKIFKGLIDTLIREKEEYLASQILNGEPFSKMYR